jgi:uncharacterized protein YbjT (DUF2867 family)
MALRSTAPSAHLVYISIVGVDGHPYPYYRAKAATEAQVEASGLPWSIQRATQFHEFLVRLLRPSDRLPFVVVPAGFRFQPMATAEAARRLVEIAGGGPSGRLADVSGPEVHAAVDLARSYRRAMGKAPRVFSLPLAGRSAAAFRRGDHILATPNYGQQTWQEFLGDFVAREASPRGA